MDENKCGMFRLRRCQLMGQALPSGWGQVESCQAVYEGLNPLTNNVEETMDASLTKCSVTKGCEDCSPCSRAGVPFRDTKARTKEEGAKQNLVKCSRDKY